MRRCTDCNGSGEYIGFTAVESCRTCGGSGEVRGAFAGHADQLRRLLHELDWWRAQGSVTFTDEYLNKILVHVRNHPDSLPEGANLDAVVGFLKDEIQLTWDITLAHYSRRAALLRKRVGQFAGLKALCEVSAPGA